MGVRDGLQQGVVSVDLLQQDYVQGTGVVYQQGPGVLIVDQLRDLSADVCQQLQHLTNFHTRRRVQISQA